MVSVRPPISNCSRPLTKTLGTIFNAPVTVSINVTFMFHNFFNILVTSKNLSLFLLFEIFDMWSAETALYSAGIYFFFFPFFFLFFFLLISTRSGRLIGIRWSVCISKSQRNLNVSFSRTDSGFYIYHLPVWSNFDFLQST